MDSKSALDTAGEAAVPSHGQPSLGSYIKDPISRVTPSTANTIGLLNHTLLPDLNLHATLSLVAYTAGRLTHRVDAKDWLWPSGMVINAWYNGVIYPAFKFNVPLSTSLRSLSWTQKLLLGGVTAWGARLFYRIVSRGTKRGKDDPRYTEVSNDKDFWNMAFFTVFLPEAVFQSLISLSWTIPLTAPGATGTSTPPREYRALLHAAAVGLYSAGMGLEILADSQLESHKASGDESLTTNGVWSIVRHPNYLGDTLIHLSFPLLLYADNLFHPLTLLGPLFNYIFLRHIGGDGENENNQEARYKVSNTQKYAQLEYYRGKNNSLWPSLNQLANPWTWAVAGIGAVGVSAERAARKYL